MSQETKNSIGKTTAVLKRAVTSWRSGLAAFVVLVLLGGGLVWRKQESWTADTRIRVLSTNIQEPGVYRIVGDGERELNESAHQFVNAERYLEEIIEDLHLYRDLVDNRGMTDDEVIDHMRHQVYWQTHGDDEINFHFMSNDPETARRVTEEITSRFMQHQIAFALRGNTTKVAQLDRRLGEVEDRLDEMEADYLEFQQVNAELIAQIQQEKMGVYARPSEADEAHDETRVRPGESQAVRRLRLRLRSLHSEADTLRNQVVDGPSPQLATLLERQRTATVEFQRTGARHATLMTKLTAAHPDAQASARALAQSEVRKRSIDDQVRQQRQLDQQNSRPPVALAQIEAQILEINQRVLQLVQLERNQRQQEAKRVASALQVVAAAKATSKGRESQVGRLDSTEAVTAELGRYKTSMDPVRTEYQDLMHQKLTESFQLSQLQAGSLRYEVIDPARSRGEPEPPTRKTLALLVAPLALLGALGLMIFLGFINDRIYRPDDLLGRGLTPFLISIDDLQDEVGEILREREANAVASS